MAMPRAPMSATAQAAAPAHSSSAIGAACHTATEEQHLCSCNKLGDVLGLAGGAIPPASPPRFPSPMADRSAADVPSQSLDRIARNGVSNGYTGTLAILSLDETGQYMVLVTVTSIDPRIGNYTISSNFSLASSHQYKGLKIPAGLTHPRLRAHCAADPGRVCKDKAMRCGWDDATSESRFGNVEYVEGANQRWLKSVQQVWLPPTLLIMTELLDKLAH